MRILMVSISSPHFFNWAEQLKDSGHDVYWLDVLDSGRKVETLDFAHQITGWRYRRDFPGRYWLKKNSPKLTKLIGKFNEKEIGKIFEEKLKEIRPHVVHSFVMHLACFPILEAMSRNPSIKWIYSSWGSDLYYYHKHRKEELQKIKHVLPKIDYMFADCHRDYRIALELGFRGKLLGVFPGRGGFDLTKTEKYFIPFGDRRIIAIKGFQGKHGRCISVLRAATGLQNELSNYNIIVFGADQEVRRFVRHSGLEGWKNLLVLDKISHLEVLRLLGRSFLYIGNSSSDGMPNTLLEAIIMGVFPIQSNPGGATSEIIEDDKNGLLIEDPEDEAEIRSLLQKALQVKDKLRTAVEYNLNNIRPQLERRRIKEKVLHTYHLTEKGI